MNDLEIKNETQHAAIIPSSVDAIRVQKEVEGAIIVAQKFPRNINQSFANIISECERPTLADKATYAYPRGGQTVTGPSIRLAEVLARNWKNLNYGIRELSRSENESQVEAFCWDMENNVKAHRIFSVPHIRDTKQGAKRLTDARDIYENVANMGSRRLRACILEIIPVDIVEDAVKKCKQTLSGNIEKNIDVFRRELVAGFAKLSITLEMIEQRLGHKIAEMDRDEALEYKGILTSIIDGASKRSDWFKFSNDTVKTDNETEALNQKLAESAKNKKTEPAKKELTEAEKAEILKNEVKG